MKPILIYGIGQFAEVVHYYLSNDSSFEIAGFTVEENYLKRSLFKNLPVVSFEKVQNIFPPSEYDMFIPISYKKVNSIRTQKYNEAKLKGYFLISYISSGAMVSTKNIGENCLILENNVIQPFTEIGNNCIIWSGNHIGHHTLIKDNCFISSHCVISGSVVIEKGCFLGVNSTIRDNISLGKENVIGAGSTILKDTNDLAVFSPKGTEAAKVKSDRLKNI